VCVRECVCVCVLYERVRENRFYQTDRELEDVIVFCSCLTESGKFKPLLFE